MSGLPKELRDLLDASGPTAQEEGWERFVHRFSRLLLFAARGVARDHDRTMDAFAHILEQLQASDYRRLRRYAEDPRSSFTTWLVVVGRRATLDLMRQRYGRLRDTTTGPTLEHSGRRRLVDLIASELRPDLPLPSPDLTPDEAVRRRQLSAALAAALDTLSPADRLLLTLRFEDDLSAREIAQQVPYPTPFHVYRAVNAALASLRVVLAKAGVTDPEP